MIETMVEEFKVFTATRIETEEGNKWLKVRKWKTMTRKGKRSHGQAHTSLKGRETCERRAHESEG